MIVGIISDTHGHLPDAAKRALEGSLRIIHAGDIGSPDILRALSEIAPVIFVLGNNDYPVLFGLKAVREARTVISGVSFLVAHRPEDALAAMRREPVPDVCVHGHTHVPAIMTGTDASPARVIICPGSVSRPRMGSSPSVAKIRLSAGTVTAAEIISLV